MDNTFSKKMLYNAAYFRLSTSAYSTFVTCCKMYMCMEVELRLADKEEQSLEKDLVYQQVCRLMDRVAAKVDASKDDTLVLAKKVRE